jgi:hypothetical protein
MAKFLAAESRVYPTLGLTVAAGDVVELPEDTDAAGLSTIVESKSGDKHAPVKESE